VSLNQPIGNKTREKGGTAYSAARPFLPGLKGLIAKTFNGSVGKPRQQLRRITMPCDSDFGVVLGEERFTKGRKGRKEEKRRLAQERKETDVPWGALSRVQKRKDCRYKSDESETGKEMEGTRGKEDTIHRLLVS